MHRLAYVDPDVFELEMERIFARTWVYVGHESEVPQPGSFITTNVGRQPIVMARNREGQIRLLFNRCMHRGAIVCREERGTASFFRCLYHGWCYDADGKLINVPYRGGYGDYFKVEELGLPPVPNVGIYRGFVFACLAPAVEPLESWLGLARPYFDLLVDFAPDGEVEIVPGISKYAYGGNWKLHMENWADSYHPGFTHEAAFTVQRERTGRRNAMGDLGSHNVDLGHGHSMLDYSQAEAGPRPVPFKVDDVHRAALERRLGPEQAERVIRDQNINLNIYPNLLFRTASPEILVVRPVRADYTEIYSYGYFYRGAAAEQNHQGLRRVANAASEIQSDDLEAFERIQEGLRIPSIEWLLYNRGMHREWTEPSGEVRGLGADETGQRAQHREWRRLMLEEPRQCCAAGTCGGPRAEMGAPAPSLAGRP
jgi:phenylpropionate dioxygenase-like ring-hydroxylating dioxygenase large terminal subunit